MPTPPNSRAARAHAILTAVALAGTCQAASPQPEADPLFDLSAITSEPTETAILASETNGTVVFQTLEFTTRVTNGAPERIRGLYAFPEGGRNLPAVFWSMGGMAAANPMFPGLLASNGYACLAVTLPHAIRNSFRTAFDAAHPEAANMTLLARDQLRGITVLSQRPEVDPDRLACAGASYGGVFATLIAGVDPRIKAGFSFFGAGNHELGTSLPQFLKMDSLADVDIWNRTFDPAFRHRQRKIPFMWGIAFNDHWFHFPAVAKSFTEAASPDKRAAIIPYWQHGFTPDVDESLLHFLDTTPISPRPRPAYNAPGPLQLRANDGHVEASFAWTGDNPAARAELVVSYGETAPWMGWPNRAAFVFPAEISGQTATARLPIPSRNLPLIVWGNVTDTNRVLTSTLPLTLQAPDLAAFPVEPALALNAFIDCDLGEKACTFYRMGGEPLAGELEADAGASGGQALRVAPTNGAAKAPGVFTIRHFHSVPALPHRLTVRLKAERPAAFAVSLIPIRAAHWDSALVKQLVARDERLAPLLPRWSDPLVPLSVTQEVGTAWQDVTLQAPRPETPVDGYKLQIAESPTNQTVYWIDTLRMEPLWPK